jgi:hypothetical protein
VSGWPESSKLVELDRKLASVLAELKWWEDESVKGALLRKHHFQIRRITGQLRALEERVEELLGEVAKDPVGRAGDVRRVERLILDVHRIWEFFRAKLSQRYVPRLRPFLVAADEFAWECYRAAQEHLSESHLDHDAVREPPLVFFNGGWSPFAMSRGFSYEAEAVPDEPLSEAYADILKVLPIPVAGVPWYQIEHLPDAIVIGHEVGHHVEDDFGLTGRLSALLGGAMGGVPPRRRRGWEAWLGEIFGDLYGNLAAGPAFTGCLMDFLAQAPADVAGESQGAGRWALHPPAGLRVAINIEILRGTDFGAEGDKLADRWRTRFPTHAMEAFEADIPAVIKGLVTGPYPELGGRALNEVLSFTAQTEVARTTAKRLLLGREPLTSSIRPLLAGARLAFEDEPRTYVEKNASQLVLGVVEQDRAIRAGGPVAEVDIAPPDRAAGRALFDRLSALG